MRGTLYIANLPGRALRKRRADVFARDVLYLSGDFRVGDEIYIAFLGADGGQYAVATGIAQIDGDALRERIGPPLADAHARVHDPADASVVVREGDVRVLWPS
jgi:hypothetical protein